MRGWCQDSDRGTAPQDRSQRPVPVWAVSQPEDSRRMGLASHEACRAGGGGGGRGIRSSAVSTVQRLSTQPFPRTLHVARAGWVWVNPSISVIPSLPPASSSFCGFRLLWVSSGLPTPAHQANPDHLSFVRQGPGAGWPLVPSLVWPFPSPLPLLPRICHFTESSIFTALVFSRVSQF